MMIDLSLIMSTQYSSFYGVANEDISGSNSLVKHLFENHLDADIILRCSDNIEFKTFRSILFLGSPVLRTLIQEQLALICKDTREGHTDDLPVVHLTEDSSTIQALLLLSYPQWVPRPSLNALTKIEKLLAAVVKYKMNGVLFLLQKALEVSPLLDAEPKRFFAIASQYKLHKLAKLAARRTLSLPFFDNSIHQAIGSMNVRALYELHAFFFECKAATCALATDLSWIPRTCENFTWFSCRDCLLLDTSKLLNLPRGMVCRKWWRVYIQEVAAALAASCRVETTLSPALIKKVTSAAEPCLRCKGKALADMNEFKKHFASIVERVVTNISDFIFTQSVDSEEITINVRALSIDAPVFTATNHPFNDPRADVKIRTSDNHDFPVHKLILSFASPVFSSMFDLPRPPETVNEQCDLPVVPVSETSRTMKKFLQFCYPLVNPVLDSLEDVGDILEVMRKYDVEDGQKQLEKILLTPSFLEKQPLQVFAIAHRHRLKKGVKLAVSYTLRRPRVDKYCVELEHLPSSAYFRLAQYNSLCRDAAVSVATLPNLPWIPDEYSVLFRCKQCLSSHPTAVLIADRSTEVYPPRWWMDYLRRVSSELEDVPYFDRPPIARHLKIALQNSSVCNTCSKVHSRMEKFSQVFAAEVQKAISKVQLEAEYFLF